MRRDIQVLTSDVKTLQIEIERLRTELRMVIGQFLDETQANSPVIHPPGMSCPHAGVSRPRARVWRV